MRSAALAALLATACYSPQNPSLGGDGSGSDGGVGPIADRYAQVSVGARSVCAIGADDRGLYCWGDNSHGQVGNGSTAPVVASPTRIIPDHQFSAVSVGGDHACALASDDGTMFCWGDNTRGQVDPQNPGPAAIRTPISGIPAPQDTVAIAAGPFATCATTAVSLQCWGALVVADPFVSPLVAGSFSSVTIGTNHACAFENGMPVCWGLDDVGQLGGGSVKTTVDNPVSVATMTPPNPTKLVAGHDETCALGDGGAVTCWGGDDATASTEPGIGSGWTDIAVGERTSNGTIETCGVIDGHATCWGSSRFGGLADGRWGTELRTPNRGASIGDATEVHLGLGGIEDLQAGEVVSFDEGGCLLDPGGVLSCWGPNRRGELGDGSPTQQGAAEVAAPAGDAWAHLRSGTQHVCASTEQGDLYCWGADDLGQIDTATHDVCDRDCDKPRPIKVGIAQGPVVSFAAGKDFTCARGANGVCWGDNTEAGLGTTGTPHSNPLPIAGTLVGGEHAMCDVANGQVQQCWGTINGVSALPGKRDVTGTGTKTVDAQFLLASTCALDDTGGRWCFGSDIHGELGDSDNAFVPDPKNISGGLEAVAIAGRFEHTCAAMANGGVKCWGSNTLFESGGESANSNAASPVDVLDTTNKCQVVGAMTSASCAACGSTIRCWGRGGYGALGRDHDDGTSTFAPAEVNLPTSDGFVELSGGNDHACALTTTSHLVCWGYGPRGELGIGARGSAVPVQVGPRS